QSWTRTSGTELRVLIDSMKERRSTKSSVAGKAAPGRSVFPGNEKHLQILKESLRRRSHRFWNQWRLQHPRVKPDLRGLILVGGSLVRYDLARAQLDGAVLVRTDLTLAHLERASLKNAELMSANLSSARAQEVNLSGAN